MEYIVYGLIILLVLVVLYVIGTYNGLVGLRNKVRNQWSQIDVVLKNRSDLIPNIVETVKGYAAHESATLEAVISARNKYVTATTNEEKMASQGEISGALSKLFALSEAYPDLKANQNFLDLQAKLSDCEDKIRYARQFYNDAANQLNNKIEMFPSNIVANAFKFDLAKLFEATEAEKEVPKVQF